MTLASICQIVGCNREPVASWSLKPDSPPSVCAVHDFYYRVVLADPKYRNQPVPELVAEGSDFGAQVVFALTYPPAPEAVG